MKNFRITTEDENFGGFVVETDVDYTTVSPSNPEWAKICFDHGYDLETAKLEVIRVEQNVGGEWKTIFDPWYGIL